MVLAASEDKRHPGAFIASPSMPWAFGSDRKLANGFGPYALVWSRQVKISEGLGALWSPVYAQC
jgi:glucoamylase